MFNFFKKISDLENNVDSLIKENSLLKNKLKKANIKISKREKRADTFKMQRDDYKAQNNVLIDLLDNRLKKVCDKSIIEKIEYIMKNNCIYSINFARAGVGMCFADKVEEKDLIEGYENWKHKLYVLKYYDSFEDCVNNEYARIIKNMEGK